MEPSPSLRLNPPRGRVTYGRKNKQSRLQLEPMQTSTESSNSTSSTATLTGDLAKAEDPIAISLWRKWLKRGAVGLIAALVLLGAVALVLMSLAAIEPEFYRTALVVDLEQQRQHGSELESKILNLHNSVLAAEEWSVSFSEEQLNGWLAWDLERKFPGLIPPDVREPRVKIEDQQVTVAFRCDAQPFRGVGIVEAEIFLTGVLNQVGIRFKAVRSGMIPIPLALFTEQISEHALESGVEIEWLTDEGDPAVIIDIPDEFLRPSGNYVEIKSLEVKDRGVHVAGVTHLEDF